MLNPQIFRMGNNQLMIVENGVTRIVKDKKILSMTNEEIIHHLNELKNKGDDDVEE